MSTKLINFLAILLVLGTIPGSQSDASSSFIPANCDIDDWCLIKASPCNLMYDSGEIGNFQSTAKYSLIRRAFVTCSVWSGTEKRTITGPIEDVAFRSGVFANLSDARSEVLDLCNRYRDDWVSLAPVCK